ncbi:TPA: hypothetical protein ACH3X3_008211 [Trebouxia sp. C0006]
MQNPEDCAIKEELADVEDLMQQSLGRFDPAKIYCDPQFGSHKMANYVGPLKVISIPGKGRGYTVTQAVKSGTLLAVGKPLGINKDICGLIDDLTQASSDSKQTLQCIYALCDGTEQSVANVPDVQMFASNGTECQAHTEAVDSSKIVRVVKTNVLYGVLSLVNHSCCPNSTYYILNEAAVLRAGQDLAPGDEVTISYFGDLSDRSFVRQRALEAAWHFACSCPRCTVEEALHWKTWSLIGTVGSNADKDNSHDPDKYSYSYRAALATGSKPRFDDLARELNVLVDMLEEKLSENDLPLKHQHWTMFSGLQAYLCLWQCCEVLKDTQRLQQLANTVSAIFMSTQNCSAPHVNTMVRISKCAARLCPGTDWADKNCRKTNVQHVCATRLRSRPSFSVLANCDSRVVLTGWSHSCVSHCSVLVAAVQRSLPEAYANGMAQHQV